MRTIDFETGLKGRALFQMAQEYYRKAEEFERLLGETLGVLDGPESSYCGHFSDQMISNGNFDTACNKADIKIAPAKRAA